MKVVFTNRFGRDLRRVKDRRVLQRVRDAIANVESAANLREIRELKKLAAVGSFYRIRIGDYRLARAIENGVVEFIRCLPRRDLYRHFP